MLYLYTFFYFHITFFFSYLWNSHDYVICTSPALNNKVHQPVMVLGNVFFFFFKVKDKETDKNGEIDVRAWVTWHLLYEGLSKSFWTVSEKNKRFTIFKLDSFPPLPTPRLQFHFWEQCEVAGAMSGEYGGCGITTMLFSIKNIVLFWRMCEQAHYHDNGQLCLRRCLSLALHIFFQVP